MSMIDEYDICHAYLSQSMNPLSLMVGTVCWGFIWKTKQNKEDLKPRLHEQSVSLFVLMTVHFLQAFRPIFEIGKFLSFRPIFYPTVNLAKIARPQKNGRIRFLPVHVNVA
jgi:hypothetical protein